MAVLEHYLCDIMITLVLVGIPILAYKIIYEVVKYWEHRSKEEK